MAAAHGVTIGRVNLTTCDTSTTKPDTQDAGHSMSSPEQPLPPKSTPDQPSPPKADNAKLPENQPSPEEIAHFITTIKNAEQQIGEHVIRALQHADTVAVLTTVVVGPGGQQHIVSAALNPSKTAQVNRLLQSATEEREEEEMCVGFHCLIKPKQAADNQGDTQQAE